MPRLFFAALLSEEAKARVVAIEAAMRRRARAEDIRWVDEGQLHVTLKFLGHQPEESVAGLEQAADLVSARAAPFELAIAGAGGFPSAHRPRVVWLGIVRGAARLADLAGALDRALAPLGIVPEARPFAPHLTLARTKSHAAEIAAARAIASVGPDEIAASRVSRFALMESETTQAGARYSVVREHRLAGAKKETSSP